MRWVLARPKGEKFVRNDLGVRVQEQRLKGWVEGDGEVVD